MDNAAGCVITKPLTAIDGMDSPGEKIRFTNKNADYSADFPAVSHNVVYGYNRFRNKSPFTVRDSIVTFYLKGNTQARNVRLSGSFNNWNPEGLGMRETDSGWVASVKLTPGKYWYKFIVDGDWTIDTDNRNTENDGRGNTNSIFYVPNVQFSLEGYTNAKRVILSGSFNGWEEKLLAMEKTSTGWRLPIYLADGTHTYRFIVDGRWITDPANPNKYPNEFKEFNSVIRLGPSSIFNLEGYKDASSVVLTGTFNKWRKDELFMKKTATGWELEYTLGPGNHEYRVIVDGKEIKDAASRVTINNESSKNSIVVLNANYTFRLKGFSNSKKIYLAGDFNDWNPSNLEMIREGNEWIARVHLSPGKHLYKFVVDGKWIIDPDNTSWEQNEFGTGNSVLWIGQ